MEHFEKTKYITTSSIAGVKDSTEPVVITRTWAEDIQPQDD